MVTYDPRGTGRSTAPADDVANYGLSKHVADLEAVRQAVSADQVDLLGHSSGGLAALYYAAVYPQRVRSIILVNSVPPDVNELRRGQRRLGQRVGELTGQGIIPKNLPPEGPEYATAIRPVYFSEPNFEPPSEIEQTQMNWTAYHRTVSALGHYDLTEEAAKLRHPVLVLWGEDDPFGLAMGETTRDTLSAAALDSACRNRQNQTEIGYPAIRPERFYAFVTSRTMSASREDLVANRLASCDIMGLRWPLIAGLVLVP